MDSVRWFRLAVAVLATWRVSHLLAEEDGPFRAVVRLRAALGRSALGSLLDCFYCLSVWVSIPAAIFVGQGTLDTLACWPAISGAACLLERLGGTPGDRQHSD